MERARRFRFAGSGSDNVPAFRFELFRPLAHPGEDLSHVVAALAGDVVADSMNLRQNFVVSHGSTSHQISRRANDRAIVAELLTETLDTAERCHVVDMLTALSISVNSMEEHYGTNLGDAIAVLGPFERLKL